MPLLVLLLFLFLVFKFPSRMSELVVYTDQKLFFRWIEIQMIKLRPNAVQYKEKDRWQSSRFVRFSSLWYCPTALMRVKMSKMHLCIRTVNIGIIFFLIYVYCFRNEVDKFNRNKMGTFSYFIFNWYWNIKHRWSTRYDVINFLKGNLSFLFRTRKCAFFYIWKSKFRLGYIRKLRLKLTKNRIF